MPVTTCASLKLSCLRFVENSHPGVLQAIREKKAITDEIEKDLDQSLKDFKERLGRERRQRQQPRDFSREYEQLVEPDTQTDSLCY